MSAGVGPGGWLRQQGGMTRHGGERLPGADTERRRSPVRVAYPGTFNPFTAGHLNVVDRARHLFDEVVVLVAVNPAKDPEVSPHERAAAVRAILPADWTTVSVAAWRGLTATFCRRHEVSVIVRGVRNTTDYQAEYQLAAMNEALGVGTVFLPASPELVAVSSTVLRQRH